jgi:hypothetical protein
MKDTQIWIGSRKFDATILYAEIVSLAELLRERLSAYNEVAICLYEPYSYLCFTISCLYIGKNCFMLHPSCGRNTFEKLKTHNVVVISDKKIFTFNVPFLLFPSMVFGKLSTVDVQNLLQQTGNIS